MIVIPMVPLESENQSFRDTEQSVDQRNMIDDDAKSERSAIDFSSEI
jgi:hypothetical protein